MADALAIPMRAQLLFGRVMHRRLRPRQNRFNYPVLFLRMPMSALAGAEHRWFSLNRWNLFSLHFKDYGPGDGTAPQTWLPALLATEGFADIDGEIVLQTFPRVLGYVFNPVSFWFCHDRSGATRVILAEVNNTFGERHAYLLARADRAAIGKAEALQVRKAFHVSPFLPVEGGYRFRFMQDATHSLARIEYFDLTGDCLHTSISGDAADWQPQVFLRAFLRYGPMSALVIARIHYQALRLWCKRARFFRKPAPPNEAVTR